MWGAGEAHGPWSPTEFESLLHTNRGKLGPHLTSLHLRFLI